MLIQVDSYVRDYVCICVFPLHRVTYVFDIPTFIRHFNLFTMAVFKNVKVHTEQGPKGRVEDFLQSYLNMNEV